VPELELLHEAAEEQEVLLLGHRLAQADPLARAEGDYPVTRAKFSV
jgi:hypothetical protein